MSVYMHVCAHGEECPSLAFKSVIIYHILRPNYNLLSVLHSEVFHYTVQTLKL